MKGLGYAISAVSLILLALVSWKAARSDPWLQVALLGGVAGSLIGMLFRFISHWRHRHARDFEEIRRA